MPPHPQVRTPKHLMRVAVWLLLGGKLTVTCGGVLGRTVLPPPSPLPLR